MQKKNSKLESFLFRSLPEYKYERIRGYESCIVVSEKENKAFKYVILGDEWIYLTENPPKTIQESVSLGDVVSVELVNDYPDFLLGDDKRNSQHIAITYWTSEPVKRRSFRKKKSPRSGSLSDLHGDRSNASTPLSHVSSQDMLLDADYSYSSLSSAQFNRPDSRGSISSARGSISSARGSIPSAREIRKGSIGKKKKKSGSTLRTIQSETEDTILKSLKEELEEEDILEDLENQSEVGESMSKSSNFNNSHDVSKSARSTKSTKSARSVKSVKSARPLPMSPIPISNAFEASVHDKSASVGVNNNDLPKKVGLPTDHPDDDDDDDNTSCCCSFNIGKTKVSPFCGGGKSASQSSGDKKSLFSASEISSRPNPSVHIEITDTGQYDDQKRRSSIHSSVTTLNRPPSRSGTPAQDDFERRSMVSIASVSDFGGSMNRLSMLSMDTLLEKRKAVLNLYLLSNVSPMLMLIRSAWSNFLLSSTLLMNPDMIETPKGSVMRSSQTQREKTELLFQQLKRDILNPDNSMEELFDLFNELRVATEKNFSLKKLFWKNSDLFHLLVKKLQQYLPKTGGGGKHTTADEFEFVSLMVEILCMMFHESEIIPERTQSLKAERGRSVVGLLMALTCTPEVAGKKAVETEAFVMEFTKTSLATVFELFLMAKQANWGYSEGNFYNISWMVKTMEEVKHTEVFVSRVVTMMMQLISPSSTTTRLSPEESVNLYQQFFVLDTFLQYSPRLKTFICSTYTEEFKYFVQAPAIMQKLPQNYPLYYILLALIEEVVKKVVPQHKTSQSKPKF